VDHIDGCNGRIKTRNSMMRPSSLHTMMSTPLMYLPCIVVSNSMMAVCRHDGLGVVKSVSAALLACPGSVASPVNVWLAAASSVRRLPCHAGRKDNGE